VLAGEKIKITETALRAALRKQGMHTRELRLKLLEERHLNKGLVLSEPQQQALHDFNPCLRERLLEYHQPGLLLIQDAVDLGKLKNLGRTFLHVVIDPRCCLAFAAIAGSDDPTAAVAVLNDQALAFFGKEGIAVQRVMAGRGVVTDAGADPGYEKFLKSQSIALKLPPTGSRPLNGFIERFVRSVQKGFLAGALRSQVFQDFDALQSGFDDWLEQFNRETPLPGYPIMGRAPLDAFRAAAAPKAAQEKTEDRPTPKPETELGPAPLPLAAAAEPSPPEPRAHEHYEWNSGWEIWGFRVVNAALVCLVIYFGWVAASQLLDAPRLEENLSSAALVQTASAPGSGKPQKEAPALAEYHVVWDRDLFAVSRPAEQAARREKIAVDKIALAGTDVGLNLIGTAVANNPKLNYAIIDVASARNQEIFREKDRVGKAVIKAILRNNVIIEKEDAHCRWVESEGSKGCRASLARLDLKGADLFGSNLRSANLSRASLANADLSDCDLENADLENADLKGASLAWANIRDANLRGACLIEADLRWADLRQANLAEADFRGANLSGADLRDAILMKTDFRGAKLKNTILKKRNPFSPAMLKLRFKNSLKL